MFLEDERQIYKGDFDYAYDNVDNMTSQQMQYLMISS